MKRLKLLHKIMVTTHMYHILAGFLAYFFITALAIWLTDESITSFADSMWYCFAACTTVGFGDVVASGTFARILTVLLTLYGILVVAFIPGVIVSYVTEFYKIKHNDSAMQFLDKLEDLENLSKEELAKISAHIKKKRYKL